MYARHPEELEVEPDESHAAGARVGAGRASRGRRASSTCCSRGPSGCRSSAAAASSSGCSSRRRTGSSRTARRRAGLQRGSDAVTSALWRRSLAPGRASSSPARRRPPTRRGGRAGAPALPGLDERFSRRASRARRLRAPHRLGRSARRHRPPSPPRTRRAAARRRRRLCGPADGARRGRVSDEELGRAVPPGRRVRRHEPLRGLRLPGARGDGLRDAGRRVGRDVDPRDRRRRRPALPARRRSTRSPRRSAVFCDETGWRPTAPARASSARPSSRGSGPRASSRTPIDEAASRDRASSTACATGARSRSTWPRSCAACANEARTSRCSIPDDPVLAPFAELGGEALRPRRAVSDAAARAASCGAAPARSSTSRTSSRRRSLAARLARVPRLVVTHHTPELPRRDNVAGRAWQRLGWATRPEVIYTSETDRAPTAAAPHARVELGIDLDRFACGTPRARGAHRRQRRATRGAEGTRDLLAAAPLVLERHPDVRFVDRGRRRAARRARDAGAAPLGDRFEFLGERDDVPDLLASFEVFAFPSLFEGLCLAVIEAQAAGVPVVATPVGGIRETVVDGETGFSFRSGILRRWPSASPGASSTRRRPGASWPRRVDVCWSGSTWSGWSRRRSRSTGFRRGRNGRSRARPGPAAVTPCGRRRSTPISPAPRNGGRAGR